MAGTGLENIDRIRRSPMIYVSHENSQNSLLNCIEYFDLVNFNPQNRIFIPRT